MQKSFSLLPTFKPQFLKVKKCSEEASAIFEDVLPCRMIFHEEGNGPRLRSKSQTLCTGPLHRRLIWSKHVDTMRQFLPRVSSLGISKVFQNYFSVKSYKRCLLQMPLLCSDPVHKVWDFEWRLRQFSFSSIFTLHDINYIPLQRVILATLLWFNINYIPL